MKNIARLTMYVIVAGALASSAWAQGSGVPAAQPAPAAKSDQKPAPESVPHTATEMDARAKAREAARAKRDQERLLREHDSEDRRGEASYARGTAALDAGRWAQALDAFTKAAAAAGPRADGALYWKAYAEYKLAQKDAALATLKDLQARFKDSRWLQEARALEVEVGGASGAAATAGASPDDELKLLAISSLIDSDSEQVVPMLEKILSGQHSPQLKKRALFVLAQSKAPRAREVVVSVAKGSGNPDLQLEAVRFLGAFGGAQNVATLTEIYAVSKDVDVKRRILEAYMFAGQQQYLAQAARSETEMALRLQAVQMLGAMHATSEIEYLYQAEVDAEVKRAIVEAYMMSGDADRLTAIAKGDRDPAMRLRAIEMLGALGRSKGSTQLAPLYWTDGQTKEARQAVIMGLFFAGDAKSLVEIARKESDQDLRKAAVERLSLMKSKEATDFLMELIKD